MILILAAYLLFNSIGLMVITPTTGKYINNPTLGNATRLGVQGVAIGATAIPVVGWGVSAGISTVDLLWGDQLYNWIDKP